MFAFNITSCGIIVLENMSGHALFIFSVEFNPLFVPHYWFSGHSFKETVQLKKHVCLTSDFPIISLENNITLIVTVEVQKDPFHIPN